MSPQESDCDTSLKNFSNQKYGSIKSDLQTNSEKPKSKTNISKINL